MQKRKQKWKTWHDPIKYYKRPEKQIGKYRYIRKWGLSIRKGHEPPICKFFATRPYYNPWETHDTNCYKELRLKKFQRMLLYAAYQQVFMGEINYTQVGSYFYNPKTCHPGKVFRWRLKNHIIKTELELLTIHLMETYLINEDEVKAMLYEAKKIAYEHAKATGDVQKILDVALYSAHILGMAVVDLTPPSVKKPSRRTITGRKGEVKQDQTPEDNTKKELIEQFKIVDEKGFKEIQ